MMIVKNKPWLVAGNSDLPVSSWEFEPYLFPLGNLFVNHTSFILVISTWEHTTKDPSTLRRRNLKPQ